MDINTVAENLTELLTNSVNMTSVFYDLFINPTPKDVTLKQYNDNNQLVDVVLPNRAKDRQICLSGTVSPEGSVVGNVGECYVNTVREEVWFKAKNSGQNTGWILALTEGSVTTLLTNYVQKSRKINGKALSSDVTLTASDVGALPTGTSYGYSLEFAGVNLSLKDKNGTNLSTVAVTSVGANRDLSNLTDLGNKKVVPSQDGASGKFLTSDGTNASWQSINMSSILEAIYPVGGVYIGTQSTCPIASLLTESVWEAVSTGRVLQGSDDTHAAGTTIEAGLPNITGRFDTDDNLKTNLQGAFYSAGSGQSLNATADTNNGGVLFDASKANAIYGNSTTVQPPAFVVNIWQRVS